MAVESQAPSRLDAARREQTPQAVARLAIVGLFIVLWGCLWVARIPMPLPFLIVLGLEGGFFVLYLRLVRLLNSERLIGAAHYSMLAAEILFHTAMVYFLGGITWLGSFAYVFGLIFTNTFLDLRRGFFYTAGAASSFVALALLEGTGAIPHYTFLDQGSLRYEDPRFVTTTIIGGVGVFFSTYLWINWVGHQIRRERDSAVDAQEKLQRAHAAVERVNAQLEERVRERTVALVQANSALRGSEELLKSTIESTADGILVVDSNGRVAFANRRFAEMWDIPDDLIAARDDAALIEFVLSQIVDPEQWLAKVRELYASEAESLDSIAFIDGREFERYSRPLLREGVIDGRVWSFRDVTSRKEAEEALKRSVQNFRLLFADNPHPMFVFECGTNRFLEVNEAAIAHYGYSRDEFLRMTEDDVRADGAAPAERETPDAGQRHRLQDGRIVDVLLLQHDLTFDGRDAVLVVAHDITEQKRADEERAQMIALIEATTDLVSIIDATGRRLYMNAAGRHMLGIPSDSVPDTTTWEQRPDWARTVIEKEVTPALAQHGVWVGELAYLSPDGREIPVSQVTLAHKGPDGKIERYSTIARDISERKRFEDQLIHLANHDPLTSLFNRRRFDEEVERQLNEAQRYGVEGALLFMDLDQFKDVNDSRGHRSGDELLTGLASLLRERLRRTDVVARLGGDEFAILLPHTDAEQARAIAGELLDAIRNFTFMVGGSPLRISASIGIALFPEHGTTAGELLSRADLAMYRAKDDGRNRFNMFAPGADWQAQIESRIGWYQRIREALEHDLFVLHAQPILDLARGEITQYELLLRMTDGSELVLPGAFLDTAERTGLIQDIDRWVVKRAISLLADPGAASGDIRLEVNLSGKAFADGELLPMIQRELREAKIDPARLVLEVTETAAIANIDEAQKFLRTLRGMGCGFALDDFGVGFSSFSHLKHLPVDYLKIDGSFIRDLSHNTIDQHLVRAIVGVARGLGKRTIAEFVADEETLQLLREYGVDYGQGFHIAEPAPLPAVISRKAA
jgi:diguanylate cyclase (GGDEF)-like protein/PAS domain S-box-containing protein